MFFRNANWVLAVGILVAAGSVSRADHQAAATQAVNTEFARQFERDIAQQQHDAAINAIDAVALVETSEAGINAPADEKKVFTDNAAPSLADSMVSSIIDQVKNGGAYKFMRMNVRDKRPVAEFRLDMANGSINYYELYLENDSKGEPRIVDVFDLAKGELASKSMRRFYIASVVADDKNLAGKLGQRERELADNINQLQAMMKDSGQGQYQAALDIYKSLPQSVQHEKTVLIIRVTAADQLIDTAPAEYQAAIADFEKYYPKDPAGDLLKLDRLITTKQYDLAHQDLDRLAAFIGDDGNWEAMHGNVYFMAGPAEYPKAIAAFNKAIAIEPDRSQAYWGLVTLYLAEKDNDRTAAELTQIQKNLKLKIANLTKIPIYADFVKSSAYRKWLANQPRPASTAAVR